MVQRMIHDSVIQKMFKGKAVIITGPRQSGKTTLINMLLSRYQDKKILQMNADDIAIRNQMEDITGNELKRLVAGYDIVFIDEAQRIKNIGLILKIVVDEIKKIQLIATGSSSLDLANEIKEPLTGRKYEYTLYPLSFGELVQYHGLLEEKKQMTHRMVFGYYPEIVTSFGEESQLLHLLADSYLYKDLLAYEKISRPSLLDNILKALALQVGKEVTYHEVAQIVGADKGTVEKYINLMEKSFIIFKLPTLYRNVRNEIKKGKKYYFWDNGILNSILGNYNPVSSRTDLGTLWENIMVSERRKYLSFKQVIHQSYFWRTTQGQEIDLVEESRGRFSAYEIKYNPKRTWRISDSFTKAYQIDKIQIVNAKTFVDFLLD